MLLGCSAPIANIPAIKNATPRLSPNVSASQTQKPIRRKRSSITGFLTDSKGFQIWEQTGVVTAATSYLWARRIPENAQVNNPFSCGASTNVSLECNLTCHAQCSHLVPDFCGMSMEVANQILSEIRTTKRRQTSTVSSMTQRQLRPTSARPTPPPGQTSISSTPDQYSQYQTLDPRRSSAPPDRPYEQPSRSQQPYPVTSGASVEAAKASYAPQSPIPQSRPLPGERTQSSQSAQAAAAAALTGKRTPSQKGPTPYQRSSTDYSPQPQSRVPAGAYQTPVDALSEHEGGYGQGRVPPQQQQPQQPAYDPAAYAPYSGHITQTMPIQPQVTIPQPPQAAKGYKPQAAEPRPKEVSPAQRRIGLDHFNFLAVL